MSTEVVHADAAFSPEAHVAQSAHDVAEFELPDRHLPGRQLEQPVF